jgi:hypothetical protein
MTCEVAVLNKHAVVIAADSAVTYLNGSPEKRYSKGGNKIFQLSNHHAVGVMIYDSGSLLGVPWELVIKEFREYLGAEAFETVEGYAREFLEYLRTNLVFFPGADRDEAFLSSVKLRLVQILLDATEKNPDLKDARTSFAVRKSVWEDHCSKEQVRLAKMDYMDGISVDTEAAIVEGAQRDIADWAKQFASRLADEGKVFISDFVDLNMWIETAVCSFTRDADAYDSKTGIVFCGYGTAQIFSSLFEVSVAGFIGDNVVSKVGSQTQISRGLESQILQFATTSMVDVFTQGYGFEIWIAVQRAFREKSRHLVTSILAEIGAENAVPDLEQRLERAEAEFRGQWTDQLYNSNFVNLRRSIGTLPVDEMVHLAETLVVLESLKEKVTSASQSVGGPVDVAVITRYEGLVWVKRKHYFDAQANPRFVARQQQAHR